MSSGALNKTDHNAPAADMQVLSAPVLERLYGKL